MMSTVRIPWDGGSLVMRPEAGDGSDDAFLFRLFAGFKLPEMAAMPVDEAVKEQLLRMQFRSMSQSYRAQYPSARFEILELDCKPVGRLITDVRPDTVYFPDIAVLPDTQRSGLATALMRVALDEARRLGVPGTVKVLGHNTASLRLCAKLGFTVAGEDPPYLDLIWHPPA